MLDQLLLILILILLGRIHSVEIGGEDLIRRVSYSLCLQQIPIRARVGLCHELQLVLHHREWHVGEVFFGLLFTTRFAWICRDFMDLEAVLARGRVHLRNQTIADLFAIGDISVVVDDFILTPIVHDAC